MGFTSVESIWNDDNRFVFFLVGAQLYMLQIVGVNEY